LENLRQGDGAKLPPSLHQRLLREFARWQLIDRQIDDLERERSAKIRDDKMPQISRVRRLMNLKGIGQNGAWLLVYEFFGWRQFKNWRELGSLSGLTPTPYDSGESRREQGISKAGNRRVRRMMMELAWGWLRYRPENRTESLVPEEVWQGQHTAAQGGHRGAGTEAARRPPEVRGRR
jgi:transposase